MRVHSPIWIRIMYILCHSHKGECSREDPNCSSTIQTKSLSLPGCFLFCWIPFFTCNIVSAISLKTANPDIHPSMTLFFLTTWLGYVNSTLNPLIYTVFNHEFRKAFKKIVCFFGRARAERPGVAAMFSLNAKMSAKV